MNLIDEKVKTNLWRYLFQCFLATVTISAVLLFLNVLTETAIIAALGASAFIVFTMPLTYSSDFRRLIGGYIVGITIGVFFSLLSNLNIIILNFSNSLYQFVIYGSLAVGFSIFIMTLTNTEHAPATGISLGLVINSWDYSTIIFIVIAIFWMAGIRKILKSSLMNLSSPNITK